MSFKVPTLSEENFLGKPQDYMGDKRRALEKFETSSTYSYSKY